MRLPPLSSLLRAALVALPLAMAACEDFDWFDQKKTPLAGDRKPVFPGGVPGVNYNAPPLQPTNSNIPIDTQISATGQAGQPGESEKDQPASRTKTRTARNAPQNQPPPPAAQPAGPDPWADARTPN